MSNQQIIGAPLHDISQGLDNVLWCNPSRRHLVQKRSEKKIIIAIDNRYVNVGVFAKKTLQMTIGIHPAKSGSQNDNSFWRKRI